MLTSFNVLNTIKNKLVLLICSTCLSILNKSSSNYVSEIYKSNGIYCNATCVSQ